MTSSTRLVRTLAPLSLLALVALLTTQAAAQNGSNYHVLHNAPDGFLLGVGAGGTQTAADGIGTWIPGEDLRGSLLDDPDGPGPLGLQYTYRHRGFNEAVCVNTPGPGGQVRLHFPGIFFIEFKGLNPNQPVVFTQPVCSTPLTASFIAYGTGPGSSVSFLTAATSALGPTQTMLLPDIGLVNDSGESRVAAAVSFSIPLGGPGAVGCYSIHLNWIGSTLACSDGIDGLWHYALNSPDGNQYWQLSTDEMNIWQSNTVASDGGASSVLAFASVVDYALLILSTEANTHAVLAPHGIAQDGPYYDQTENMANNGAPNLGFDVGRGSRAVSFSGLGGVKVPPSLGGRGAGAQDPAYGTGGTVPTLGFVSWDNKPNDSVSGLGSKRLTWVSVDRAQLLGLPPTPGLTAAGGKVRLPIEVDGFLQAVTMLTLPQFTHQTKLAPSGWPDPAGLPSGAFGVPPVAGGSMQVLLASHASRVPCNIGLAIGLQYGSSGFDPHPPGKLTFNPHKADISGRKEVYIFQ